MRTPEFWQQKDYMAKLAVALLTPVGWAYGATVAWKASNARPFRAAAKTICVGNLTAGGSGKTPIAIAIARAYRAAEANNDLDARLWRKDARPWHRRSGA
jgi:tetraacyldisaccharide 4'-kinase